MSSETAQIIGVNGTNLGAFTGTILPDGSNIKAVLQAIETAIATDRQEIDQLETDVDAQAVTLTTQGTSITQLRTDLDALNIPDITGLATETYVDTAVAGVTVDLSGYYTKTEIDAAGYLVSNDLSNYYTKAEVDTAIAGATGTDLSNYYTKTEVDGLIPDVDAANFTWNASLIPDTNAQYDLGSAEYKVRHLFLSDNSIKFESGDVGIAAGKLTFTGEPLAMESYVDAAVAGVTVDLSGYYTKTEIDNAGFLTSFSLGDGDTLELGADADLQIYYDGTLGVQT